jgi:CubicO group peptidase (beta-lactamase class C family)
MTDLQARIRAFLDEQIATGPEVGLQVAAYHRGELVVDAWAGVADIETRRAVDGDTVFVTFSVSKGVTATIVHLLAERGQLDYDAPIARVWPGFARHGKEGITVRHVLTHSAGLAHLPLDLRPEDAIDWDRMCAIMEDSTPAWEPGTRTGYHALTFGWILGEVVRRVDGRPIERVLAEDVCAPLGIDALWFGMPESAAGRLARLEFDEVPPPEPGAPPPAPPPGAPSDDYGARVVPPAFLPLGAVANRPEFPRAVIPAAGGVANARSLARLYASLVGDGVDGRRLLPRERVRLATTLQTDAPDVVVGAAWPKAMGYFLGSATAVQTCVSPTAFGHTGAGGFTSYADPAHDLAFALCKTHMLAEIDLDRDPARRFERELHALLLS